ncbi:MAG: hypothetical protein ACE5GL_06335 [Calditrichia bacterium]
MKIKIFHILTTIGCIFLTGTSFSSSHLIAQKQQISGKNIPEEQRNLNFGTSGIQSVEKALDMLKARGDYMAAWSNGHIPPPWYTTRLKNMMGFRNHLQGIQRVPGGNYLVISGSNTHEPMSNLFIVKMNSRRSSGDWTSNLAFGGDPPAEDGIVKTVNIDSLLWHAGGISMLGNILAVPVYGGKPLRGRILFYDMSNPEMPRRLNVTIERPGRKAYAVSLVNLQNGYILVVVLSDRDHLPRRLDFYLSNSGNIVDGFREKFVTWFVARARWENGEKVKFSDYQSINLLQQTDGQLFLIGFHNTIPSLRIIPGKDYGDLYKLHFPPELFNNENPQLMEPKIEKLSGKQFYCKDGFCNMDAAAGLYIHPDGTFTLYAATFWLENQKIKFTSFTSMPDTNSTIVTRIEEARIDLFEDKNIKGHRLSLYGIKNSDIPNYEKVYAQGQRMKGKISSARYLIPEGYVYRLFTGENYEGRYFDLVGSGQLEIVDELNIRGLVKSSRYIRIGRGSPIR